MSDDPYGLRNMTDHQLYIWIGGWQDGCDKHIAGTQELRRRNKKGDNMRANIALTIAGLSFLLSLAALLKP